MEEKKTVATLTKDIENMSQKIFDLEKKVALLEKSARVAVETKKPVPSNPPMAELIESYSKVQKADQKKKAAQAAAILSKLQ